MRCRKNDVGLLDDDKATAWRRRYADPNVPNLYAAEDEEITEDVTFDVDVAPFNTIPTVQENSPVAGSQVRRANTPQRQS